MPRQGSQFEPRSCLHSSPGAIANLDDLELAAPDWRLCCRYRTASSIGHRRVAIESAPSVNPRMARPPRPLADVKPLAGNPGRDLGSRSDAQLGPHVVHVRFGGPRRDVQLSGNLLACEPLRDQAGYFNLALGQAARWFPLHSRNRTHELSGLFYGQLSTFGSERLAVNRRHCFPGTLQPGRHRWLEKWGGLGPDPIKNGIGRAPQQESPRSVPDADTQRG